MKTFQTMAAQGEFIIIRREALPEDIVSLADEKGVHVIAHSETGHNHVMDARSVKAFTLKTPSIYTMFLQVDEPTEIMHLRSFDTHESILVTPGIYEIKRQREFEITRPWENSRAGFRRARD